MCLLCEGGLSHDSCAVLDYSCIHSFIHLEVCGILWWGGGLCCVVVRGQRFAALFQRLLFVSSSIVFVCSSGCCP